MDALFAPPTGPASASRVRAFAELALNQIHSGVGSDASLLADRQSFSEFMDRVNESVLLGRREPPPAASVLRDTTQDSQKAEEGSSNLPAPDNDVSVALPISSLQSFDMNSGSNTGPSTFATNLEAVASKLAFSPRRHRRQYSNKPDPGHNSQSKQHRQSWARPHRVRFDVCDENEDLGTGAGGLPEPLQHRKHGADIAQEEEEDDEEDELLDRGEDKVVDNDAPLPSCDLAGPGLLQELRRWRSEATAEINTDHSRPPVPPAPKASISGRPSPPLSWGSTLPQSSQLSGMSPPSPPVVHRGDSGAATTKRTLNSSARATQRNAPANLQEFRVVAGGRDWHGSDGSEDDRATGGEAGGEATRRTEEFSGDLHTRGSLRRVAGGSVRRTFTAPDRPRTGSTLVDGAQVISAGRRWRDFDSNGQGKGTAVGESLGLGEAAKLDGEGEQEQHGAEELSLDLSDCSDEKLGAVLQRGRRLGSRRMG